MASVRLGDIGTVIELDTGEDLANATAIKIKVKKPNGEELEWLADKSLPTSVKHTVAAGELDVAGYWLLAAYVEFGTSKFSGETAELFVRKVFDY